MTERRENEEIMNEMSLDEFLNQIRTPIVKSERISVFLGLILDMSRYYDFDATRYGLLEF